MKPTCITQLDNKNLLAFKLTGIALQNVVLKFLIEIYGNIKHIPKRSSERNECAGLAEWSLHCFAHTHKQVTELSTTKLITQHVKTSTPTTI